MHSKVPYLAATICLNLLNYSCGILPLVSSESKQQATSQIQDFTSIDCIISARQNGFTLTQADTLCKNNSTTFPVTCTINILSLGSGFTINQAINTCKGATSLFPSICAKKATLLNFSSEQAVNLCSNAIDSSSIDCAQKALRRGLNAEDTISYCTNR